MDIQLIVLALYVFASAVTAVCALYVLRWARENSRAREALILRLSKDPVFVQKIGQLQFSSAAEDEYKAEIARLQSLILEQMRGLGAAHAKLLKEPITQRSLTGRTGYIENIAKEVKRISERATA